MVNLYHLGMNEGTVIEIALGACNICRIHQITSQVAV